jgi:positive regulator of sigma E activity
MLVPLLPILGAILIGATIVGVIASAVTKLGTAPQWSTPQSTLTPIMADIVAVYGLAVVVFFGVMFFGALSYYYLIDRRNRHFARQQLLFASLQRYVATKSTKTDNVSQLSDLSEDFAYEEQPRPAGLWALLFMFVTPLVGLIASYNLTQDMRKHDELQFKYQTALTLSLVDAGFQRPDLPKYNARKRDPVLFLVLSAITGGLFWVYWFYTLLKDYNDHFADQARFEDRILSILAPPQEQRTCGQCGGSIPTTAKFCPNCGRQQTT